MQDHIAFIDLSYFIFFRFYALQRWLKVSKYEFKNHDEFIAKFSKLFEDNIVTLKKRHKLEWNNIILAKDCMRHTIWRLNHFSDYKKNRDETRDSFDPRVFVHTYEVILPMLVKKYLLKVVDFPTAEADDVIAVLHKMVREFSPPTRITIFTNDNDYLQLVDEKTTVMNLNKVILSERAGNEAMKCFKLCKIIKGDVSDNIPPIDKKIGEKTALKLAQNPELLERKLASDPHVRDRFELNKKLIDFGCIPNDIVDGVHNKYKQLVLGSYTLPV